jgi:hypothetical protein
MAFFPPYAFKKGKPIGGLPAICRNHKARVLNLSIV